MPHKKNEKGFTLIELTLMIILMGLLALTLGLNLNQETFSAYSATTKVVGDVRFAQQSALTSGQVYGFRTLTNHSYEIYVGAPGTPATNPLTAGPFTVDLSTSYPNATFGGTYQIEFDAKGAPTIGGGSTYTLTSSSASRAFQVQANTGFIKKL